MHIGTFPFVLWIDVFLPESEPVRIGQADAMTVVDRIVYIEGMVAIIELDAVLGVHPVVAACGITDFIGTHLPVVAYVVKRLFIYERFESRRGDPVGEGEHAAEVVGRMQAIFLVCALKAFPDCNFKCPEPMRTGGVQVIPVAQFLRCLVAD